MRASLCAVVCLLCSPLFAQEPLQTQVLTPQVVQSVPVVAQAIQQRLSVDVPVKLKSVLEISPRQLVIDINPQVTEEVAIERVATPEPMAVQQVQQLFQQVPVQQLVQQVYQQVPVQQVYQQVPCVDCTKYASAPVLALPCCPPGVAPQVAVQVGAKERCGLLGRLFRGRLGNRNAPNTLGVSL